MNFIKTNIRDVIIFEPKVFGDERGFFLESFNEQIFEDAIGKKVSFVQDNHSKSCKGVLRGLHFQWAPYSQGKLIRCIAGSIFDVAVDIRPESIDFGKWVCVELTAENKKQLWIPEGFAHGFLTMSDAAEVLYKTTEYYSPKHECGIKWDDTDIGVPWPLTDVLLSKKDKESKKLNEIFNFRKSI